MIFYYIPPSCKSLHHEVELGIVIGKTGSQITEERAGDHIGGYVLALDMTARDLQVRECELSCRLIG